MAERGVELAGHGGPRLYKPLAQQDAGAARQSVTTPYHLSKSKHCALQTGNLTVYKSYQKNEEGKKEKQRTPESHCGCPVRAQGCFPGARKGQVSSGVPPLLPTCDLQVPPPQQGQRGPTAYISSPDFSKQISESCPTGMSSASSGVREVDVVSLKCHKHSPLAVST